MITFGLALVAMVVGIVGTFFPMIPGIPIIWGAMLVYGFVEGFQDITPVFLVITFLVVVALQVAEHYARAWGAKKYGASKWGAWGAVLGSIAGLFFMPFGLVLGPFLGALLLELVSGRSTEEALKAGWGGVVGVLGSVVMNVVVALGLTLAFIVAVVF